MIRLKRIYDDFDEEDGFRILTDRLWPRGIKKVDAHLDLWAKKIAPSSELRKWFSHDPAKYDEFRRKYVEELKDNEYLPEFRKTVEEAQEKGNVTFLFGAKDREHNQAVVLKDFMEKK